MTQNTQKVQKQPHRFKSLYLNNQADAINKMLPKGCSLQRIPHNRTSESAQLNLSIKPSTLTSIDKIFGNNQQSSFFGPKQMEKQKSAIFIPVKELNQCYLILRQLRKNQSAWPFRTPVDPKVLKIPQYLNVINEPMDLKKIEDNIKKEIYKSPTQFHRDIYKMMMNSYKFNQKNSQVFIATTEFQEFYLQTVNEAATGKLQQKYEKKMQKKNSIFSQQEFKEPQLVSKQSKISKAPKLSKKQLSIHKIQSQVNIEEISHIPKLQPEKIVKNRMILTQDKKKIKRQKQSKEAKEQENRQNIKDMKEVKEVIIHQNQKNTMISQIQKKLTELLKKLNEVQLPKTKLKNHKSKTDQNPHALNYINWTLNQKKKLVDKIKQLHPSDLRYIIQIVYKNKRTKQREQNGDFQFDIDKLQGKTLRELYSFVIMRSKSNILKGGEEELENYFEIDFVNTELRNYGYDEIRQIKSQYQKEDLIDYNEQDYEQNFIPNQDEDSCFR